MSARNTNARCLLHWLSSTREETADCPQPSDLGPSPWGLAGSLRLHKMLVSHTLSVDNDLGTDRYSPRTGTLQVHGAGALWLQSGNTWRAHDPVTRCQDQSSPTCCNLAPSPSELPMPFQSVSSVCCLQSCKTGLSAETPTTSLCLRRWLSRSGVTGGHHPAHGRASSSLARKPSKPHALSRICFPKQLMLRRLGAPSRHSG